MRGRFELLLSLFRSITVAAIVIHMVVGAGSLFGKARSSGIVRRYGIRRKRLGLIGNGRGANSGTVRAFTSILTL